MKLKVSSNPNNKLYLLNGYNNFQINNNLFHSPAPPSPTMYQQQENNNSGSNAATTVSATVVYKDKMHKLEIEKLNLEYQVRLLKKQLNVDLLNMMQQKHKQLQQQNQHLNNNEYAKLLLMAMNNKVIKKVNIFI